jgi:flagellar basal-body rod protein FlgB
MIEAIDDPTMGALRFALDAASLRHRVFAHNIANANTEGFTPLRVGFEEQFEGLRAALDQSRRVDPAMLGTATPVAVRGVVNGVDGKVALDLEVARIAQNAVHYQALLRGAGKHLSIISAAINEGRR